MPPSMPVPSMPEMSIPEMPPPTDQLSDTSLNTQYQAIVDLYVAGKYDEAEPLADDFLKSIVGRTRERRSCFRTMTLPVASMPWTWNTFFAISRRMVVTAFMWASCRIVGTVSAATFMALARRWEEPTTASTAEHEPHRPPDRTMLSSGGRRRKMRERLLAGISSIKGRAKP